MMITKGDVLGAEIYNLITFQWFFGICLAYHNVNIHNIAIE